MRMTGTQFTQRIWRQVVLASSAALYLVLILTITTFASDVSISDQAGVLNQSQVRKAASALGYPVSIYTVNGFSGSTQQFDQRAANILGNHKNMIVIAIDTNRRYLVVRSGPDVPLTNTDATNARQAFASSFNGGDYTAATVSCLNSLKSSLATQKATNGGSNNNTSWLRVGSCLLGLLVIGGLLFFVWSRKRRSGFAEGGGFGSPFNRQRSMNPEYNPQYQGNPPPYQGNVPPYQGNPPSYQGNPPPYQGNPPPYQGNTPPYYGSGYPPQQRGINPLAAGGLGAAAGGLLGYELGKNRARQDEGNHETGSESGGNFGGDNTASSSGGFFGGGEDTGTSSGSSFGGGDTGSGSGGSFGGDDAGSDSGGFFGGSEDSGSGSGGNF